MRSSKRKPRENRLMELGEGIKTGIEADIEYEAEVKQTIIEESPIRPGLLKVDGSS
ncbi:hypothetical protein PGT21_022680 [Puccinia graminis f. sp. tritici]|uniref:Uncharacterized protein n=2 Tax=Puccinia graminis f. sp. tritici TaxID=56615 RepID=H6QRG7_PUCGT|nr:uncharacterized protein PGTG_21453 [Puccinia graminis f. sp. tritici CRL 75-36-700-3]EHS63256.1 hypothetical protein PGTG_21453 [Puccinia graminis f. sp. tritici CRL 75-36-700-3]KAA1079774.1 hypothetical protein PGT21_023836 [Puccinia graminis f. sp. tritici]KAA1083004.1 hypothetical protein PGT21_022680 [Puccinia graminis f. sp. tritici]KAA1124065.1 hypothetical protein PGTUg99_024593 [Puccinia graminis f. sp. tritici]